MKRKAVVVHAGARDAYQVALALSETGLLQTLVTDLLWPSDRAWASWIASLLPHSLRRLLSQRTVAGLPWNEVKLCPTDGLRVFATERFRGIPLPLRRQVQRAADATLGKTAGHLARTSDAGLLSYSYYGFDAMRAFGRPAMLFQVHPHPATMRRILTEELQAHPDCAASLTQEWELALPEEDYQHLVAETTMASRYIVASSFTRQSLVEHGNAPETISVVPYGVDLERFCPGAVERNLDGPLQLLFVGRINQRKGLKYLLEALRLLPKERVHLTICGRVVDDLEIFRAFAGQIEIRPSVSLEQLVLAYQKADLFVFPSVAEGFGQVLLEALASGLPILATTHTAAPDLIEHGQQGFVVEPRRPDLLAKHILWASEHREELATMRSAARQRAEHFTWGRFRTRIAVLVQEHLDQGPWGELDLASRTSSLLHR